MADVRYFRVEKDTALPRAFRAVRDNSGTTYDYEVEGIAYDAGSYVASTDIDPRVLERLDNGDEHLNSLLTEVDESEVQENAAEVAQAAQLVRLPEHSVEAYVLARDEDSTYALLSSEEGIEVNNAGFDEAAEAQKEAYEVAELEVDPVDEEDAPTAIDFAAAKGEADKKAGKAKNVSRQVQDGELEDAASEKKEVGKKGAKKAAARGKVVKQPHQDAIDAGAQRDSDVDSEKK